MFICEAAAAVDSSAGAARDAALSARLLTPSGAIAARAELERKRLVEDAARRDEEERRAEEDATRRKEAEKARKKAERQKKKAAKKKA